MDSNLHPRDSNPRWRKKWSWKPRIRISHEEKVKRMKIDSNSLHNDSNLWIWSYEEQVKAIRIFELQIRIPSPKMKLKVRQKDSNLRVMDSNLSWRKIQILQRWFESPTQRFESPFLQKHWMHDLQLQQLDFQIQSLSQWLVKVIQQLLKLNKV